MWVFWQPAIQFGILRIVQHVDHVRTANSPWIVDSRVRESRDVAKLFRARFRQLLHLRLRPEVQAAGRARFNAGWFETNRHAVVAQRALENLMRLRTEFWNIERAPRDAVAATDAVLFLKIHDAVGVLHDGAVGGTCRQTARIFAVHALIFAHQQHHAAVGALVFIEFDQVPVIPRRFRHGLVGVVKSRLAERVTVPFQARHFARFAPNARGGIHQLANLKFPVQPGARNASRVP